MWTSPPPRSSAAHLLARRGLDQRRTREKDRSRALDDHGLVRHRRNVGAAGRARSHHDGDLRDALGGHARLVVEDAPEVLAVREDLGLEGQEGAAGVDQVHAGEAILLGDFLRPQVLLHGDRKVRPALDRRVVGDDHDFAALDAPDAGHQTRPRSLPVVHPVGGERRKLQKRRARVEQGVDPVAHEHLLLLRVPLPPGAALPRPRELLLQVRHQRLHRFAAEHGIPRRRRRRGFPGAP